MDVYTDGACIDPEDLALTPERPGIVDEMNPFYDSEECPPSPDYFIRDDPDDDSDDDFIGEIVGVDEGETDEPGYSHIYYSDSTDNGSEDVDSEAELLDGESSSPSSEHLPISPASDPSVVKALVTLETPGSDSSLIGHYHQGPLKSLSTVMTALEQAGHQTLSKRKRCNSISDEGKLLCSY